MAIIYDKQAKKNPITKKVKYYPVVKRQKQVSSREVAKLLADETTLNPMEAEFVLEQLAKVLLRIIGSGNTVRLGSWISFYATINAGGSDTLEGCTASLIKRVALRARFSEEFRQQLQKLDFLPLEALKKKQSSKKGEK